MVLVATLAGVIDSDDDNISLSTDAVVTVGASVSELNLPAAERAFVLVVPVVIISSVSQVRRRMSLHPVVAQSNFKLTVQERVSARACDGLVEVLGCVYKMSVPGGWGPYDMRQSTF